MKSVQFLLLFCVFSVAIASTPPLEDKKPNPLNKIDIDNIVNRALEQFNTPGMSVAVVHEGKVIHSQGYGLANVENNVKATDQTYFRLASVSKAFTAAGLAVLVDQGKVEWDDQVISYLPDFSLQDAYATRKFTVQDLLTHQSGLVGGAGDSLIWPEPSGFTREEVIQRLRYLTPGSPFSSEYAYSNVLYITAGQLIEVVSGVTFEEFIDNEVFSALDMNCFTGAMPESAAKNSAMGYAHSSIRGIYSVPRNAITEEALMSAAAGGMVCNAKDMSKWLKALLDNAKLNPNATQTIDLPFSLRQLSAMWKSHTLLSVSKEDYEWDGTHFRSYGLGWRLSNLGAYKFISHTGTLSGYQAYIGLVPEIELGVIILNNGSNYGARGAVMQSILKAFTHDEQDDWIAKYQDYREKRTQRWLQNNKTPVATEEMAISSELILGEYQDEWFGQVSIFEEDGKTRIKSHRMKTLVGTVSPFENNSFKIDWDNENAQSDAFIHFEVSKDNVVKGAYMRPFNTRQRTNHAYRDMYFVPIVQCATVNVDAC